MTEFNAYATAEGLQDVILSWLNDGFMDAAEYKRLRKLLFETPSVAKQVPDFIRDRRDPREVQQYLNTNYDNTSDKREFVWLTFRPLLETLEFSGTPVEQSTSQLLQRLGMPAVYESWTRALSRYQSDPAGAITAARSLLENVCKHILDDLQLAYESSADLPKLYRMTAEALQIAPHQHTELVFKQILGGCTAVVEGLGALRNRVGDAHGAGPRPIRPAPRHAQLAIDLAGTVASYLFATWELRRKEASA
jgi:hypothetical protein